MLVGWSTKPSRRRAPKRGKAPEVAHTLFFFCVSAAAAAEQLSGERYFNKLSRSSLNSIQVFVKDIPVFPVPDSPPAPK